MPGAKILLIEDEELIRLSLKEFLNLSFPEVKVYTAATLAEVRKLWSQEQFHILISDCTLPDGLACDFLEEVEFKGPVIILTGMVDEEQLKKTFHLIEGPLHLLRKPVPLAKLAGILAQYIPRETS